MLLTYSDLVRHPVAAVDSGRVGAVTDIVADPHDHRVIAFVVRRTGLFGSTQLLSPVDVLEYDPRALIVHAADAVVPPGEIMKAQELRAHRIRVIGRRVETQAHELLGSVYDYVLDTETSGIVRYYVRSLWGKERVIPTATIIEVTRTSFIVDDAQTLEAPTAQEAAEVATP